MKPTRNQAFALLEMYQHDNTIIMGETQKGKRFARWKNFRGTTRAGKIKVLTAWAFKKKDLIEPRDIGVNEWCLSADGMDAAESVQFLMDDGFYEEKEGKVKVTANDVLKGLETDYSVMGLTLVPEVSIAYGGERRADALVVGRGNETAIAIEIKVSKQDYKHEIEDSEKRALALELCSQYFFATPQGMIEPHEIPDECGLMELDKGGMIRVTVAAPHSRPSAPDWRLVSAVARALKR